MSPSSTFRMPETNSGEIEQKPTSQFIQSSVHKLFILVELAFMEIKTANKPQRICQFDQLPLIYGVIEDLK